MSWKREHNENWAPGGQKAIILVIAENSEWKRPRIAKFTASRATLKLTELMKDGEGDEVEGRYTELTAFGVGSTEKFKIDVDPLLFNHQAKRKQSRDIKKAIKSVLAAGVLPEDKRKGMRLIRLSNDKKE